MPKPELLVEDSVMEFVSCVKTTVLWVEKVLGVWEEGWSGVCGVCVVEGVWMCSLSMNGHKCTRMLSVGMDKSKYVAWEGRGL